MLIIVEGPDGMGKTTLIAEARKTLQNVIVISRSGPVGSITSFVQTLYWLGTAPKESYVICDRHPAISERVYGPILRDEDLFEAYPISFGLSTVTAIIYCRTSSPNLAAFDQLPGVAEQYTEIVDAYDSLMSRIASDLDISVYEYDFTKIKPNQAWSQIASKVKARA